MRTDTDSMNAKWNDYRGAAANYDPTPKFLAGRAPDRPYRAVYFEPPPATTGELRTDGDLFVFIDSCDGTVLGVMRWCGR